MPKDDNSVKTVMQQAAQLMAEALRESDHIYMGCKVEKADYLECEAAIQALSNAPNGPSLSASESIPHFDYDPGPSCPSVPEAPRVQDQNVTGTCVGSMANWGSGSCASGTVDWSSWSTSFIYTPIYSTTAPIAWDVFTSISVNENFERARYEYGKTKYKKDTDIKEYEITKVGEMWYFFDKNGEMHGGYDSEEMAKDEAEVYK